MSSEVIDVFLVLEIRILFDHIKNMEHYMLGKLTIFAIVEVLSHLFYHQIHNMWL